MNPTELVSQARALGAEMVVKEDKIKISASSPLPDALLKALRQARDEVRRLLIVEQAYHLADQVNDALRISDPLTCQINRLGWAVCDLQDAGEPEAVWRPLREEEQRLGREWERERRG